MKQLRKTRRQGLGGSILFAGAVAGLLIVSAARPAQAVPTGYTLAWSDEFNGAVGSAPNSANWNFDTGGGGWGNGELETYVTDAAHISIISDSGATDGKSLQITATDVGGVYDSGRIDSIGKQQPTFGYIEIRAKNPIGKGIWPAFWMLGTDFPTDSWPNCGEQDIMELLSAEGTNSGSWHMNYLGNGVDWTATYTLPGGATFNQAYHTFGELWTQASVTDYVDGIAYETHSADNSPGWIFNHPFYYVLNLAVGGGPPGNPDGTTVFPQSLYVDYIRYYTGPATTSPGSGVTTDPCNDLSGTYDTSGNWIVDNSNPTYFGGDSGRLSRIYNATEFVDYKYNNISAATVTIGTNTTDNTSVTLWYSTNSGSSYTQAATTNSAITATTGGWGLYTVKTSGTLPSGVTNMKIQEAPTVNSWDHQIANVQITSGSATLPTAPAALLAQSGAGQIALYWAASTSATSYNVYRGTSAGGESTTPIATGVAIADYTNTGLTNGTTYYYKVSAVNAAGTTGQSPEASAVPAGTVTIPSAPTGLTATAGVAQVALAWTASSGATSYNVYSSVASGGEGSTPIAAGLTSTAFTNTGLTNGTKYYYTVAAVNTAGTSAQSTEASATPTGGVTVPSAPTGVTAAAGNALVALAWTASSGATTYNVYRGTTAGGESATAVATGITATSYSNTGLTNGTKYYFTIAAVNSAGTSSKSSEVSATPTNVVTIPSAPTGVTATAGSAQVGLGWTASAGATTYNVYRGTTSGGESATAIATGITATVYTNTGLTNGTKYYYTVAAVNSAGTSSKSAEVSATPAAGGGTTSGPASINCGGAAASPFVADADFSGGTTSTVTNAINTTILANPVPPQAVLQSSRQGNVTYTMGGFTAGSGHVVTLYFSENQFTTRGSRVFNVAINGTTVLSNFDIFANTNTEFKAIQEGLNATASSTGQIVVTLTGVTGSAQVNGISTN